jgi:hypothetical protein
MNHISSVHFNRVRTLRALWLLCGLILLLLGISKLWATLGPATLLHELDPVFNVRYDQLMVLACTLEISVELSRFAEG